VSSLPVAHEINTPARRTQTLIHSRTVADANRHFVYNRDRTSTARSPGPCVSCRQPADRPHAARNSWTARLLQIFYSIRSERLLMERLDYNLLFRWFEGMDMNEPTWDTTVFTKNRDRLLTQAVARTGSWRNPRGASCGHQSRWLKTIAWMPKVKLRGLAKVVARLCQRRVQSDPGTQSAPATNLMRVDRGARRGGQRHREAVRRRERSIERPGRHADIAALPSAQVFQQAPSTTLSDRVITAGFP
jgi:Transposase domain (DUF772)